MEISRQGDGSRGKQAFCQNCRRETRPRSVFICGMAIDSIDEAREQGWIPYFYEGQKEHGPVCPYCSEKLICKGEDGEMEVKEEYRGKITYLDRKQKEHLIMGIMVR